MMSTNWIVLPVVCLLGILLEVTASEDPCIDHLTFDTSNLGSRNERCPPPVAAECDYFLREGWYIIEEGAILTHCPITGNCGVGYPVWMNGTLPMATDGIVNRTVCIKGTQTCCNSTMDIKVRRCSGFYAYYLKPVDYCPAGYCFESNQPCVQSTAQPTTSPAEMSTQPSVTPTTTSLHDSNSWLIAITVTSGLVLAIVSTLLAVVLLQKWFKRKHEPPRRTAASQAYISGKTVTAPVIRVPDYEIMYNIPVKSQSPDCQI